MAVLLHGVLWFSCRLIDVFIMFFHRQPGMQGCMSLRSGPLQWASIATCSNSKSSHWATFVSPCQLKQGSFKFLGRLRHWNGWDQASPVLVQEFNGWIHNFRAIKICNLQITGPAGRGQSSSISREVWSPECLACGLGHSVVYINSPKFKPSQSVALPYAHVLLRHQFVSFYYGYLYGHRD